MPYFIAVRDEQRRMQFILSNAITTASAAEIIRPLVEKDYPGMKTYLMNLSQQEADAMRYNGTEYKECQRCTDWIITPDFMDDDNYETDYCSDCRILNEEDELDAEIPLSF